MINRRAKARLATAAVAGLAAALAGCLGPIDLNEPAAEEPVADPYGLYDKLDYFLADRILVSMNTWGVETPLSDAQVAELADGTVTEEEHLASFERYRACLREAGYEMENVHMNGPFVWYGIPGPAVDSGADDVCYFREHYATWVVWTEIHNDENERQNDIHRCVYEHDIDTSTESGHPMPLADMERLLVEAGVDPENC